MERGDDLEEVRRAQEGDLRAYERLVQRHERKAYGLAFSLMGNREDAEDMLQESFLKAFRALPSFRRESSFRTWFYRIVINRCNSERRKKTWNRWFRREEETVDEEAVVWTTPRDEASLTELSRKVEEAVQKLPPQQRLVFTMKTFEGMKLKEIAETLNLRVGTVKSHFFQATQKMQQFLNAPVR